MNLISQLTLWYNRIMKNIVTLIVVCAFSSTALAQFRKDNVLDLNYNASFRDSFSLRWSSRIAESQDWNLRGFNAGGSYALNKGSTRLSVTYDLWRGYNDNDPMAHKYGLAFSTTAPNLNLAFSLFKTDGANNQMNGFSGRLDLNMKFK